MSSAGSTRILQLALRPPNNCNPHCLLYRSAQVLITMQAHGFSISFHAGSPFRTFQIPSHPHSDQSYMFLDPSNATTPVGWYPEPSFRGTYSLLSSCVSTLLICVLSAVHLDVPAVHHNRLHKWAKKAKWVAVGVFAPEWLTMTAYLEWQNARGLASKANDTLTFVDSVCSLPTFETSLFCPFLHMLTC